MNDREKLNPPPPPPPANNSSSSRTEPEIPSSRSRPLQKENEGKMEKDKGKEQGKEMPVEMKEKLEKAKAAQRVRADEDGQSEKVQKDEERRDGEDGRERRPEREGMSGRNAPENRSEMQSPKGKERANPTDDSARNVFSPRRSSNSSNPPTKSTRTLKDLTPEQRERYLQAKANAQLSKGKPTPTQERASETTKTKSPPSTAPTRRQPKSLDDLTEEERVAYLEARSTRKRMEREFAARHVGGRGGSGLSMEEKEGLISPT